MQPSAKWPEIAALTGLGFLAAFSILYAHEGGYFVRDSTSVILKTEAVSDLGMTLFFTHSGFVIHTTTGTPPLISSKDYRRDVDGLRGLSIISVVLFHAFPEYCPGGFRNSTFDG